MEYSRAAQAAFSRRTAMFGLTALATTAALAVPAARAGAPVSPLARGVLQNNPLAQMFRPANMQLPEVALWGPNGKQDISAFRGRTILMPLWTEWCALCLSELPLFARLQQKYGNDKFAIVPVLTGTQKRFTPDALGKIFARMQLGALDPLIEDNWGGRLMRRMAVREEDGAIAMPCNLLIGPDGRVVGRAIGLPPDVQDSSLLMPINAMFGGPTEKNPWGREHGEQFAAAMAAGFLA